MFNGAAVKWTGRIHKDADMHNRIWVQHMNIIDEECIKVRRRLGSFPMPEVLELVGDPALREVTNIISSYDTNVGSRTFTTPLERCIYENTCQNMLKSVLFPYRTKWDIGIAKSDIVEELLVKLLYVVPNIKILVLPPRVAVPYTDILMERIQILNRLEEFEFNFGCTSEILIQLSKHCLRLKKISVQFSKYVNDSCVEHLLNLRGLISLKIANTSITANGYARLLSGLPDLQNIRCYNPIDPVLRNVTVSLPSVNMFTGKVATMRLLVQKCPNIRQLKLVSIVDDPSALGELKNVVNLSFQQDTDTPVSFSPLITQLGPNLTRLRLLGISTINLDVIINYCTCLKKLSIMSSNVECDVQKFNPKSAHFQNVNNLRLVENFGPFDFCTILHLYTNLTVLDAVEEDQICDHVIKRIIIFGGFRHLTEFVIEDCGYLSMESVLFLLNCCPNLTTIGLLNSWPGIPEEVLLAFITFIQTHNLPLAVRF
jgi:hypothetical protein